jgi:hypothetical protein
MRWLLSIAALLVLMQLILSGGSTSAQAACPNLTGRYVMQYEDGRVHVTIAQVRCESMQIDTRSQYLHEPVVIGRHKLRLDGEFREDTGWNGSTSKQLTSTKLRDGILEIVTKPAKPDDPRAISWQVQFRKLDDGDLCQVTKDVFDRRRRAALIKGTSADAEAIAAARSEQGCGG